MSAIYSDTKKTTVHTKQNLLVGPFWLSKPGICETDLIYQPPCKQGLWSPEKLVTAEVTLLVRGRASSRAWFFRHPAQGSVLQTWICEHICDQLAGTLIQRQSQQWLELTGEPRSTTLPWNQRRDLISLVLYLWYCIHLIVSTWQTNSEWLSVWVL